MPATVLPRLQVLAAAFLFSTGGMAVKSCQLSDWQIASFRCGVAAAVMWLALPAARRGWTWRTLTVGLAYAGTLTCYALANKSTTAANAVLLQSTAPLYLVLLGPLVLGERSRWRDVALMVAMAVGLVVLLSGEIGASPTAPSPARGNVLGALAGVCWALTILGLRWLQRSRGEGAGESAAAAVVAGNLIAFVAPLALALPVVGSRPADWGWVIFLGVFQVAVPYVFLTSAVGSVPAFEAALLLLVEPVFNPVWAWWVHGEVASVRTLVGGGVILLVTVLKTWLDLRRGPR